jgi:cysteine-rich repeat protein
VCENASVRRALVVMAILLAPVPAHANFHLMKVVEVFGGSTTKPNAQYVVLQMYNAGQNVLLNHKVHVFDAAGVLLQSFTFPANVANGTAQAKIVIATTDAQTLFNLTADLTMAPVIRAAGGKVCFEAIDCVAWGSYAKAGGDATVGTPVNSAASPIAGQPVRGLVANRAIVRRLDIVAPNTTLQAGDDTNNSANDFLLGTPAPKNNANQTGTVTATCGDSTIGGLESCDDGNTTAGDGCDAACTDEFCGNLVVDDTRETCDDGNSTSGDGCDANCKITACGNGIVTAGEVCDDGNLTNNDGCDANCTLTACGNGIVTAGETCDDGNLTSGDGCDANCTPTGCGNGIVTAGEACEPPGQGNCSATCQIGCSTPAECADTDPCTTNERCVVAQCLVDPVPTDDNEPCTIDSCVSPGGVVHDPQADGTSCTLTGSTQRALCVAGTCVVARCGDGFVDPDAPGGAEECDDANAVDDDACTNACRLPRCGDAIRQTDEECDDGNLDPDDGCSAACAVERCGDTLEQTGEECDDGNVESNDGCSTTCLLERCGDGVEQFGEQCDDGNDVAGDGCEACMIAPVTEPPRDGGGCCGTGRGDSSSVFALGVLALVLRRRRRV